MADNRIPPVTPPQPPPEPPPTFPGFEGLVNTSVRDTRAASKRLQEIDTSLIAHNFAKIKLPQTERSVADWVAAGRPGVFSEFAGRRLSGQEAWERRKAELLVQRQEAIRQVGRAEWFSSFYESAPSLFNSGMASSLEDYLALMKLDPTGIISEEDFQSARATISKMIDTRAPVTRDDAPEFLKITPEQQTAVRTIFALEPEPPETIHRITVNQLLKSITRQPSLALPKDWTVEQTLQYAAIMDIPAEDVERAVTMEELIEPFALAMSEREEYIKAVLAGDEEWQMPELGFMGRTMFTFLSPMQQFADWLLPYFKKVSYPWTAKVIIKVPFLHTLLRLAADNRSLETEVAKMEALDYSPWQALSEAYQDWPLPWYLKLMGEIITDPLSWTPGWGLKIPGNIAKLSGHALLRSGAKGALHGGAVARFAGRELLSTGKGIIELNKGIWFWLDIPFDAAKALWGRIPKTFNQATKASLDEFRGLLRAAAEVDSGHLVSRLTPVDLAKTLNRALKAVADTPMKQNDTFVMLGKELIEHAPPDARNLEIWSRSLGGTLKEGDVTLGMLTSVDDAIGHSILKIISPAESAKRIAIALGIEDTPAIIAKLVKDINVITRQAASRVPRAIEIGKTATFDPTLRMTEYLVASQKKILSQIEHSTFAKGKILEGAVLSVMNKVDTLERGIWRVTLDRWLVRPMAEAYLGSVAYPIWNVFEGMFVSALEGVVPRASKIEAFHAQFAGIRGVDAKIMGETASDVANLVRTMPGREGAISLWQAIKGEPGQISLLKARIPEKIKVPFTKIEKPLPRWIAGADWFEWTALNWIRASDMWGNGYRRNFLMRKMSSYLAEYSYNVSGQDLNAAFRKLISNKSPSISKKSLGLTKHELEQDMFARVTSGVKSNVLDAKEIYSNTSLMQGEAMKILRQATELSPQAKALGEQMIVRGEALGRIPLRPRVLDWNKVTFDVAITPKLQKVIRDVVNDLPVQVKTSLVRFEIAPAKITGTASAIYDPTTRTISFRSSEHVSSKAVTHEVAHSIAEDLLEVNDVQFFIRYTKAHGAFVEPGMSEKIVSDFLRELDYSGIAPSFGHPRGRKVHEAFARDFAKYIESPSQLKKSNPAVSEFLSTEFPKTGSGADTINVFAKTIADQSIADLRAYSTQAPASFRFMADQIETQTIDSADSLMQVFQHFEVMSDTASKVPTKLLSQVFDEADILKQSGKFSQLETLWRTSRVEVENIVDSIGDSLNRARAVLESKSGLLTEPQQNAMLALLQRDVARLQLQEQFLRFDGRLLDDFWALPKATRTKDEHTALRAFRQENMLKYKGEDAVLGAGDFLERKTYSQLYNKLPRPRLIRVDASTRALTADDAAKAMGANVDALTTGMMESMTFQDKVYFIQMVKQSADANPTFFKGFTEEKIGVVYDDIIRGLRMSPEADIAMQKILQQAEGVKQSMLTLRMTKSLKPAEEQALHGWIDDVAEGMDGIFGGEATPGLRPQLGEEGVIYHVTFTDNVRAIEKEGVLPLRTSNWVEAASKKRYGGGNIFATENLDDAIKWAGEMDWEFHQKFGSRRISIIPMRTKGAWEIDVADPLSQLGNKGKWFRRKQRVPAEELGEGVVVTEDMITQQARTGGYKVPPPRGRPGLVTPEQWQDIRQKASESAHREYYKAFADYTNENIIDAVGKSIYPFWTYHLYRWFFLSRTFIRKPGVALAWGKYYEYSDYGYQHIPGTDLEFNPAVGSAFGATFSLGRHDFKSYYENLGFMGEVLDFTQRRGWFPSIAFTLPIALTPIISGRPPELGEVLAPIQRVGLNLFVNSEIPGVADAARWLKDRVFHENFHEYYTATIASSMQSDAGGKLVGGQSGAELWQKKQRGEVPFTEEEQILWDAAYKEAAWIAILRSEFPEFRLIADDLLEGQEQVTALIEAQTGMDADFQDNLWRHNMRPSDLTSGYPLELRTALDQMWQWRIYLGRGKILMPPEQSDLFGLIDKYRGRIEEYQIDRIGLQMEANKGFLQPTSSLHFDGGEWRREYAANWSSYISLVESLEKDPEYVDAIDAMTTEGQIRLAKELGFSPPPIDPFDEAVRLYFEIELHKKTDPFTGEEDFDYLRFWLERESVRQTLQGKQRSDFDTYIRRFQTPMEVVFKNVSNTYLRGYRAVSRIVLEEFTIEEKALIAEFYADATTRERKLEIQEVESHSGKKLISFWDSRRTDVRNALRRESPVLDFWLFVFGYTSSPKSDEAKAMIDAWEKDKTSIVQGVTESPMLEEVIRKIEEQKTKETTE